MVGEMAGRLNHFDRSGLTCRMPIVTARGDMLCARRLGTAFVRGDRGGIGVSS